MVEANMNNVIINREKLKDILIGNKKVFGCNRFPSKEDVDKVIYDIAEKDMNMEDIFFKKDRGFSLYYIEVVRNKLKEAAYKSFSKEEAYEICFYMGQNGNEDIISKKVKRDNIKNEYKKRGKVVNFKRINRAYTKFDRIEVLSISFRANKKEREYISNFRVVEYLDDLLILEKYNDKLCSINKVYLDINNELEYNGYRYRLIGSLNSERVILKRELSIKELFSELLRRLFKWM